MKINIIGSIDGLDSYREPFQESSHNTARDKYLQSKYGLSLDAYNELLIKQKGVCAICGGIDRDGRKLAVDHDHQTNKVRGLLCSLCNTGLGSFGDNIGELKRAIAYLRRHHNEVKKKAQ